MFRIAIVFMLVFLFAAFQPGIAPAQEMIVPENKRDVVCRVYERHVPSDDVAYDPDKRPKGIASPEMGSDAFDDIDVVEIPLSVDLADRLENVDIEGLELDADLGTVKIHSDGRVTLNGRNISAPLRAFCATPGPATKDNGQGPADIIGSDPVIEDTRPLD